MIDCGIDSKSAIKSSFRIWQDWRIFTGQLGGVSKSCWRDGLKRAAA
jgi:hypothetical protein